MVNKTKTRWQEDIHAEVSDGKERLRCVRTKRWKCAVRTFVENRSDGPSEYTEWELYDLKADPWELNNLMDYKSQKKACVVMRDGLYKRLKQVGEDLVTIRTATEVPSGQKILKEHEWY
ncbi:MAG TPA: hypothetical protein DDZ89_12650, partial [Clostridiales bacterium]|nr:hypothetical protein [Clostridiales bacterium]